VASKHGLGKGLSALLPADEDKAEAQSFKTAAESQTRITESPFFKADSVPKEKTEQRKNSREVLIPLDALKANPAQPRKDFDETELEELSDSIKQQGIIQPIIADEADDGTYTIIAGERRTRAARLAGLKEIPAIIRKYSDEKRMIVSLIENIQRSNLNPIEEAAAYKQLMDSEKLSQDEAAARVGKNRATVANTLRLLKLPPDMQESMRKGELSAGHARAVLSVSGAKAQNTLFMEIIKKGLSVREAEKRAAALGSSPKGPPKAAGRKQRAPELDAMEEKFINRMGTKVAINGDLNRGKIEIDYYSMEDLERLYEILSG